MDCPHEEIQFLVTLKPSNYDNKARCLQCGKVASQNEFPNAKIVEATMELDENLANIAKSEPDGGIALKNLIRKGQKFQELREKCRDPAKIKSLIENREFPFEDDFQEGLLIVKAAMLPEEKLQELLNKS